MCSIGPRWLLLMALILGGCSGVPVAKVAALHRGENREAVARELGNSGCCSCQLVFKGADYAMIRYSVGRRGDGYLFVFKDDRLLKISKEPHFNGPQLNADESADASYDEAVQYINWSSDVLKPDDPPAEGPNWAVVELAAGWTLAMSPFLVIDIPFIPIVLVERITARAAARDPGAIHLHDPISTAVAVFGKPLGVCVSSKGFNWRQYHSRAGWFAWDDGLNWTDVLAVVSRDDRIIGAFSQTWLHVGPSQ